MDDEIIGVDAELNTLDAKQREYLDSQHGPWSLLLTYSPVTGGPPVVMGLDDARYHAATLQQLDELAREIPGFNFPRAYTAPGGFLAQAVALGENDFMVGLSTYWWCDSLPNNPE